MSESELTVIERNAAAKLQKLVDACPEAEKASFQAEMDGFRDLFSRWLRVKNQVIDWEKIKPPPHDMVVPYEQLKEAPAPELKALSKKLAVLKLNGGLGTTMGCKGPKSVIEVHSEQTFLDLIVQQIEGLNQSLDTDIPLVLMNSFNTHKDTKRIIHKYQHMKANVHTFDQSRFPRVYKESFLPVPDSPDYEKNTEAWYPPGHGDVFFSIDKSGLLDKLMAEGREYLFISNVDNLGATVDLNILKYMEESGAEYIMEVTDKTRSDIKGGTLIEYEGRAKLLEIAQCPPNKVDEFKSIKKFKIFNTNNIWVKMSAIKRVLKEGALKSIDIITNYKKLDNGQAIIQLETACGAAIEFFKGAKGINVNRSRFLPVKSTSDLFIIQSNLYTLEDGHLKLSPKRVFPSIPLVKLGDAFTKVPDYMKRLQGIPDLLELDQLTVSGDVTFGSGVVLKGTVIIVANHGCRIDIPSGAVLENKVVSGNLRILEH